ncbi:hypothetical protein [Fibrella rubiginis]|uniref:hypothetical protein n=1 Tax=Fibrella rubiginis TaxID=2817060 RepID=UPI001E4E30E5|nr:hypothetical protein [Fibrella rubiginis]
MEGIETGREAGREEGREQTQIDIILTGHQEGFSPEQLSKLTKLSLDQVLAIIAENI